MWCPHTDSNRGPTDYKSETVHLNSTACNLQAVKPLSKDQYLSGDLSNLTLHQAALYYASLGWPIFPVYPNEKNPLTGNGFKDATTDQDQINHWWAATPTANIGLALEAAGLVAFDPDLYKPDCEWETFVRDRELPETLTQATASGGKHFIFVAEAGKRYPGKLCKHVDVKHAGYIVLAPSVFHGNQYRWENTSAPAPAPAWFDRPQAQLPPNVMPSASKPSIKEVAELLRYVNADLPYDEWSKILMAVHDGTNGSDDGLTLVDQWSATGSKYRGLADVQKHWQSFRSSGVTISTLADAARAGGANLAAISHLHRYDPAQVFANHPVPQVPTPLPVAPKSFDIFTADRLSSEAVTPRNWLVPDMIPASDITLLGGDGGTGKSLVALQLAASVACGHAWLNKFVFKHSALFISAEDTRDEIHRRLDAIRKSYGVTYADLNTLHLLSLAGEDAILAAPSRGNILHPTPVFEALKNSIAQIKPALLVLDTLADLFGGEENQRAQARQFVQLLRGLCIAYGVTIVLLNHPSLSGMNSGSGASGSTGWNNSVRSRLYLERIVDDGGFEANVDARRLSTKKANYARAAGEIEMVWHGGVFMPSAPLLMNETDAHDDRLFLQLLAQFTSEQRHVSSSKSPTYAPTSFVGHPLSQGVTKRRFEKAMNRLLMAGAIRNAEHGPPSKRRSYIVLAEASS